MSLVVFTSYYVKCDCCKRTSRVCENETRARREAAEEGYKNLFTADKGEVGFDEDYCPKCYEHWRAVNER